MRGFFGSVGRAVAAPSGSHVGLCAHGSISGDPFLQLGESFLKPVSSRQTNEPLVLAIMELDHVFVYASRYTIQHAVYAHSGTLRGCKFWDHQRHIGCPRPIITSAVLWIKSYVYQTGTNSLVVLNSGIREVQCGGMGGIRGLPDEQSPLQYLHIDGKSRTLILG